MKSKSKYAALLLSSLLVIYAVVGSRDRVNAQDSSLQQLDVFSQVYDKILSDYVDQPSANTAIEGAIRGLVGQVDPYGGYLSAKDVAFYNSFNFEKTVGIGVVLGRVSGYPMVLQTIPGGPAAKAGLKTGDVIEAIDGIATQDMNAVQVNAFLAIPADKPATLTLIGNGRDPADPEMITVPREVPRIPPVEIELLQGDIAHVRIPVLSEGKVEDARKRLEDVIKRGASGIVLDLRATAAGKDEEGFDLANLFIDSGTLGYLEGQKFPKKLFTATSKAAFPTTPLVVLIDTGTGGPAELAAAALSGNKRAKLVGTRTFGMGVHQNLIPLEGGNALLISVAKYYTPGGKEIFTAGILPDVRVPESSGQLDPTAPLEEVLPTDPPAPRVDAPKRTDTELQLDRAIEILRESGAARKAA